MASKKKGLPVVIYTKAGPDLVTLKMLTDTLDVEDRIMDFCCGDKKKKKHYHYVVTEMPREEIILMLGQTVPIETIIANP